jgi:16S rRNA (guanine527-N7)-methyltransferase
MLDSAQLLDLIPASARSLIDIGSGAGFPGLVLSILGKPPTVHLVEADARKCAFLTEVARLTNTAVSVHNARAESVQLPAGDVITARAVAALSELLSVATRFATVHTIFVFPKGREYERELLLAQASWKMDVATRTSRTDPQGTLIMLSHVRRLAQQNS